MLSGSPVILESFYRTEVLGFGDLNFDDNHISNRYDKYQQHHYKLSQRQGATLNSNSDTDDQQEPRQRRNSSKASVFKTTAMSAFNSNVKDAEYPIINVEAENEHFEVIDNVISWMETCRTTQAIACKDDRCNGSSTSAATPNSPPNSPKNLNNQGSDSDTLSLADHLKSLKIILPHNASHHEYSAPGVAWNLVKIFCEKQSDSIQSQLPIISSALNDNIMLDTRLISPPKSKRSSSPSRSLDFSMSDSKLSTKLSLKHHHHNSQEHLSNRKSKEMIVTSTENTSESQVRMRGNDEWAPPRAQIIFNIHEETNFRKHMQRQNYRCAGCGTKIDLELARRLVLYCHYLGKYFCKCCFSHKAIHLPCYIVQKWDFHKYPVSHFALQLLDKIADEPLFNINDINPLLYKKVKKLRLLVDVRMQLYYLKIYISTCTQTDQLHKEYTSFQHQHLLQDDVHLYSLNNLIEIQHGKLHEYLNDLVSRSIAHIAQCDRCRAKGHYCQLCGPGSLMSSTSSGNNIVQTHELIFPFEIGRVAQCGDCGCCFHLQCFVEAGKNCPKCERIQRRKAESSEQAATSDPGNSP